MVDISDECLGRNINKFGNLLTGGTAILYGGAGQGKTTTAKCALVKNFVQKYYTHVYCYTSPLSQASNNYTAIFEEENCYTDFENFETVYKNLVEELEESLVTRRAFLQNNKALMLYFITLLDPKILDEISLAIYQILLQKGVNKDSPNYKDELESYMKMFFIEKIQSNKKKLRKSHKGCTINECAACYYLGNKRPLIFLDDFTLANSYVMTNYFIDSIAQIRHLELQIIMLVHSSVQTPNKVKLNSAVMVFTTMSALNDILTRNIFAINPKTKIEIQNNFKKELEDNIWTLLVHDKIRDEYFPINPKLDKWPKFVPP